MKKLIFPPNIYFTHSSCKLIDKKLPSYGKKTPGGKGPFF